MRTLFTKILLWFLLTLVCAFGLTFYISTVLMRDRPPDYNRMTFELRQARRAWETNGQAGLGKFLAEFKDASGADGVLTDGAGHDVITGKDWSRQIHAPSSGRPRGFFLFAPFLRIETGRRFEMVTASRDHKYYFIAAFPVRNNSERWSVEVPRETWWMLGIFAVLCYWLARQLTSPLRKMQKTIERFGHGDFSARVNSRRADEFGQLGRAVDQMAERIESLVKSQRRLLQDISHELRSPLARLGVAIELGRSSGNPATAFNRIEKEADRLNALVGELIQVTRAEGDPSGLAIEPVRLDELVRVIVDDVHIEADRRHVDLHVDTCEADIEGNPELLRRAIENVLRNAVRYSPEGTRVDITLTRSQTGFRVAVRDFGSGVPEDSLEHLCDPFYRVESDRGRTSGGVGLGLAIAKRAVELHHGSLKVSNAAPGLLVEMEVPASGVSIEPAPSLIFSES